MLTKRSVAALAIASAAIGTLLYAAPASAATPVVTPPNCSIKGTPGHDVLIGTPGNDVICGMAGNDILIGADGNDLLVGGLGNDKIFGGKGRDRIFGSAGTDLLVDTVGLTYVSGGDGPDKCVGTPLVPFIGCEAITIIPLR